MQKIECPGCQYKFTVEDYSTGDCINCGAWYYYWDYVLDDETYEEMFAGFYWSKNEAINCPIA